MTLRRTPPTSAERTPSRAHPPVSIVNRPLDEQATRRWSAIIDVVAVVAAATLLVSVASEAAGPVRAVAALVVVVFVPGWSICRWCGWRFSASTLLVSIALSAALVMILGQIAVTRTSIELEAVGAVLASVCLFAIGLLHATRRADV